MSNVLEFGKKEKHGSGLCVCMSCGHEEMVVAPIGVVDMECSACGAFKSRWKFEFRPTEPVMHCNCGNNYFYLTAEGHFCPNCGVYQEYK